MAVKQIQLSNIPRGELGEIMVRPSCCSVLFVTDVNFYTVGNRSSQESQCMTVTSN